MKKHILKCLRFAVYILLPALLHPGWVTAGIHSATSSPVFESRVIELGIENVGTTVVGRLEGRPVFVTQGYLRKGGERYACLEMRDSSGTLIWRKVDDSPGGVCGEYLQWIDPPAVEEPLILWAFFPDPKGGESSENRGGLFRASTGDRFAHIEKGSNNASLVFDLNGDGSAELIYSGQRFVTCYSLPDLREEWTQTEGVLFCWGYPTPVAEVGVGIRKLVWGSEYNLPGGHSSSVIAVNPSGKEIWRYDGIPEDLGSTPVFVADTNGDGKVELIKNGLDLCQRNQLEANHIFVFTPDGKLLREIPSMMYSIGLGDLDGDHHLEGFGVVSHRDGGSEARKRKSIRCVDLVDGTEKWETPVPRVGLPAANALAADVDGDGRLEAILGDGNPTFYGHLPGDDWGSLYIVNADGSLFKTFSFSKWVRRLLMCDIDDDGLNELIVQIEGAPATLRVFETQAPATAKTWPLPFGNVHHWGREHRTAER